MTKLQRTEVEVNKDVKVSILKHNEAHFELAVMYRPYPNIDPNEWDIDYSVFNDVLTATSPMEVYGTIEHIIKPEYM